MFDIKEKLDDVVDNAEKLAKNYYKLGVLNAIDKGSKVGSILIVTIISLLLFFICLIFLFFGFAYWMGEALNNTKLGFFIMAAIVMVAAVIIIALNKKLITPLVRNTIIEKLNADDDEE